MTVFRDFFLNIFSKHLVGRLLAKCNGMKEKGISPVSLRRYKFSNIFVGRSMYMQQRTGSFKEPFSKNTFYRFLNSAKTNWLRFTSLLQQYLKMVSATDYSHTYPIFHDDLLLPFVKYSNLPIPMSATAAPSTDEVIPFFLFGLYLD